jgi:hypothetical protein
MTEFTGFPEAALDFYDDLELDNTKAYWDAHKKVYVEAVQQPLKALMADLADEFGTGRSSSPIERFASPGTRQTFSPRGPQPEASAHAFERVQDGDRA